MDQLALQGIPNSLQWTNQPVEWKRSSGEKLIIKAGAMTDWFIDPAGNYTKSSAPYLTFRTTDDRFMLSAKVSVNFNSMYDAGGLVIYKMDDLWAKLAFEYSRQLEPTIVSVVTRSISDDCNSVIIDSNIIYLRISHIPKIVAFHYSLDGQYWHLVRYFSLVESFEVRAGFISQSPTGDGCQVEFSEIKYILGSLKDYRSGE